MEKHKEIHLRVLLLEMHRLVLLLGGTSTDIDKIAVLKGVGKTEEIPHFDRMLELSTGLKLDIVLTNEKSYKQAQSLKSILENINGQKSKNNTYYPISELVLSESFFPKANVTRNDSPTLLKALLRELEILSTTTRDCDAMAGNLLTLLQFYGATIAALPILEDISFYDLAKTKANIASILNQENLDNENPFLLIGGDFSGIQGYIYQIVSKYAGKNLKGRSFYIRLLSEAVVRSIMEQMKLPNSCIIYNSGGSFYLLGANTPENKTAFKQVEKKIEDGLLKCHGTTIYVALAFTELSEEVVGNQGKKSLKESWGELFVIRNKKKKQKFAQQITANYDLFFDPSGGGGECEVDHITGEEILDSQDKKRFKDASGEYYVSQLTDKQIELGKNLRNFHYIAVTQHTVPSYQKKGLQVLDYYYYLLSNSELDDFCKEAKQSVLTLYTLNAAKKNDIILRSPQIGISQDLMYYGGNESENKTFEDLCSSANTENDSNTFNRLGVLRMDVDNLGKVFQSGIADNDLNMARYSTLSGSFDYFFSGYLNALVNEIGKEELFIVYSGGDDLFIIGQWEQTIELAEAIHLKFKAYCNNPTLSISGGISLVSHKFPIMKGAEYSAKEESLAKEHQAGDDSKSSISFFEMPLHWQHEYPAIKALRDEMIEEIHLKKISKSFLHFVMQFAADANFDTSLISSKTHKVRNYKVFWMISYQMKRQGDQNRDSNLITQYVKDAYAAKPAIFQQTIQTSYHSLELWAMAARWCELTLR